jgi:2-polyprenyl-3-methyl-5-hydroxy-6-metoxy-1,4-benzoquinol methylase
MKLLCEYLDPDGIIDSDDFKVVERFLRTTGRRQIGWHYIVDLTWIYARARQWPRGLRVLDAGGGRGPAQFLLAEMGFDVTNIDLVHTRPDYAQLSRYGTRREILESRVETRYTGHILSFGRYRQLLKQARRVLMDSRLLRESTAAAYDAAHEAWRAGSGFDDRSVGRIEWFAGNLCEAPEVESGTFDAVVSLSALEHVPIESLPSAMTEIRRMVRPGGHWAVTTSGTERAETWYHAPSLGYCFSRSDLSSLFDAKPSCNTEAADILGKYRSSRYLKENLALHYRLSGKNGMPWGRWNPAYIPVGFSDSPDLT